MKYLNFLSAEQFGGGAGTRGRKKKSLFIHVNFP